MFTKLFIAMVFLLPAAASHQREVKSACPDDQVCPQCQPCPPCCGEKC